MSLHEEDRAHVRLHESIGSYVLGGLDQDDRADLEAHLATCSTCRDELDLYAGLPALLRAGAATPESVVLPDAALGAAVSALRTRRRRRWRLAVAAAVTVLVTSVGATRAVIGGPDGPDATTVTLTAPADVGATGEVSLVARPWGTSVDLAVRGLPSDGPFQAWLVSSDGERQQVATWASTARGEAQLTGASALAPKEVSQVRVIDVAGDLVLLASIPVNR